MMATGGDDIELVENVTGGAVGGAKPKKPPKQKKFDFEDSAKQAGLKEATVDKLKAEDYDCLEALQLMSLDDMGDMDISKGQQKMLVRWLGCLGNQTFGNKQHLPPQPTPGETEPLPNLDCGVTAKGVISSHDMEHLAHLLGQSTSTTTQPGPSAPSGSSEGKITPVPNVPVSARGQVELPRPHEFIADKKRSTDLYWRDFVYGSLLILENKVAQKDADVFGYARHMSFCALKNYQGYSAASIIEYDDAFRTRLSYGDGYFPNTSDTDLANRHLVPPERSTKKSPPQAKNGITSKRGEKPSVCFRWNERGFSGCTGCNMAHQCLICQGDHQFKDCPCRPENTEQPRTQHKFKK